MVSYSRHTDSQFQSISILSSLCRHMAAGECAPSGEYVWFILYYYNLQLYAPGRNPGGYIDRQSCFLTAVVGAGWSLCILADHSILIL